MARGHEPGRTRRVLRRVGALHRHPPERFLPRTERCRRGSEGDLAPARQPAERERLALRRTRHAERGRQRCGSERDLGMGGTGRGRGDLATRVRDRSGGPEHVGRVVSRRTIVATGIAIVGLYAALAVISGRLSPLARGPLLDGIGPPQPYRWVNPPPDLASANLPPSSGTFHVPLDPNGSRGEVFVTSDNQVTVIVPKGAFDAKVGQIEVTLSVTPLDPATLPSPGRKLTIFGNAY